MRPYGEGQVVELRIVEVVDLKDLHGYLRPTEVLVAYQKQW